MFFRTRTIYLHSSGIVIERLYWEDLREDLRGSRCSGLGRVGGNREWEMGMIAGVNGTAGELEGLLDDYRWWTQEGEQNREFRAYRGICRIKHQ